MKVTKENFLDLIKKAAGRDTSSDPEHWTKENSLWGHCAVVSLLAQDYFGGELVRGSLENTQYSSLHSHYWNKLGEGSEVDFTARQFKEGLPTLDSEIRSRERVLSHPDTQRRYEALKARFNSSF